MKYLPTLFLLVSPLFTSMFCRLHTFEQETKREISVRVNPNLSDKTKFAINHESRKIVKSYHHIVKKILPIYDYDAGIKSSDFSDGRSSRLDENRKPNLEHPEEVKKVKFPDYSVERSRRFERHAEDTLFSKDQNSANTHQKRNFISEYIKNNSASSTSRIRTRSIEQGVKQFSLAVNNYNISRQNRKVTKFTQNSLSILQVPSTHEKFRSSVQPQHLSQNASSTEDKTVVFATPPQFKQPIQNEIKNSESSISSSSSTQNKNPDSKSIIFSTAETRRRIRNYKNTISTTPVPEYNGNTTQKTDPFKVRKDEQQKNLISNLNFQSLIDAVQKELGTRASEEKKINSFDDVKELIIINSDPKKIFPGSENGTEFQKLGTKALKDAPTQKSILVIWIISCAVLLKIAATIFIIYCFRSIKKRKKSNYKLLREKNSKTPAKTTKKNDSLEKLKNADLNLERMMTKYLKKCKIYRKEDLEEKYSNPKHLEMIRNNLEHQP